MIEPRRGGRFGARMTALALAGLAIAAYLLVARIIGEAPACGPVKGCETVAASEYATMFGVPVALFGVGFSAILEEEDGTISYWALAHAPGRPDFHHPDCFALTDEEA